MKPQKESVAYHCSRSHMPLRWAGTCALLCAVTLLPACGIWKWTKTQVGGSGWSTPETKVSKQAPMQATPPVEQTPAPTQALLALPPPQPLPEASATEADILALEEDGAAQVVPMLPPAPQPIEPAQPLTSPQPIKPPPTQATTEPLPLPDAVPMPPTQPLAHGHYAVQVGVFFVHANALTIRERVAARLADESTLTLSERAVRSVKKGKRTYVVVGDKSNVNEAEELAQRLRILLGQGVAVFRR